MTLLMREQENLEKGRAEGRKEGKAEERRKMIKNVLYTTKSVKQTSMLLQLNEEEVRKIVEEKAIAVKD